MIGFGLADAVGSVLIGTLSDKLGRAPVLALGFLLQGSVALALMFWTPEKGNYGPPIVMALLLGVGDSVGQVVPAALCSAAFEPTEVRPMCLFGCKAI
jgi:MFS family permease